jgi:RNA polymerase sigma factor (sigma-70 family)
MTMKKKPSKAAVFFEEERNHLVGFVRSLIQDSAERDGEDIVQDVTTSILSIADLEETVINLSAFVYQALRNRVVDIMRRRKKHLSLDAELPGETGLLLSDLLGDLRYDAADDAHQREIRNDIAAAITRLDDESRAVVMATEFDESSFRELAEEWEEPIGTLLARKSRAMKKLRDTLVGMDSEFYGSLLNRGEVSYGKA